MNINTKYQQAVPGQPQASLQAQQILLQQLQQGQGQQQQASNNSNQFNLDNLGSAAKNVNYGDYANYQRPLMGQQQQQQQQQQPVQLQNFFPQQFLQQGNTTASQLQQPYQPLQQQQQQQAQQQFQLTQSQIPPHLLQQLQQSQLQQPQKFFGNQTSILQLQLQQQQQQQQQQTLQQLQPKVTHLNVETQHSQYWQHQLQLCQLSRNANIPHFYARQYAQNSRKNKLATYSEIIKPVNLIDATKQFITVEEEQEKQKQSSGTSTPTTSSALLFNKKLGHDLEDDHAMEEQRMIAKTQGKQLWCQLDLTGQGLVNLSPKLFQYDFLESLYLNNNKLSSVPSIICKLTGLRVLDLSNNKINEVPPELGLSFNLRFLYLFDNNIKTLPNEFGNLIELIFLGIEGNPLDLKYANLLAEKGTKELISYIRDLKPQEGGPPRPRPWYLLEEDGEIIDPITNPKAYEEDSVNTNSPNTFTLMSYNILCHHYATAKLYKYTPSWALNWDYRRNLLQEEILANKNDIVCMQEVETRSFHEFWVPLMAKFGYKGVFYNKTRSKTMSEQDSKKVDGCATFYKTSKFNFILKQNFEYNSVCMGSDKYKKTKDLFNRFMNKDNIALITFLQHVETGEKILLVNTHLHWDPAFNDVKTLQVAILLEELQGIMKRLFKTNSTDDLKSCSLIITGDFNSVKDSAVYQLFSSGSVSKHHDLDGYDYGRTEEGFHHNFKLKSSYDYLSDIPFTNFTPTFTDVLDYIWYSTSTLQVKGLLGKVDEEYASRRIGIPDSNFPSDHVPIITKFQIKKSGGGSKRPDFKPDFKTGSSRKT